MQMYDYSSVNPEEKNESAKAADGDKWFYCPACKKKLVKYGSSSISEGVYMKCRQCRRTVEIKIH